jgi:hypothetical protein
MIVVDRALEGFLPLAVLSLDAPVNCGVGGVG